MNPYDYQNALALAGGQAIGADVSGLASGVTAASIAPVYDESKVQALEESWAMTNSEKRALWNDMNPDQQITVNPAAVNVTPAQLMPYTPGARTSGSLDLATMAPTLFGGQNVTPAQTMPYITGGGATSSGTTGGLPLASMGGGLAGLAGVWDQVTGMLPESWGSWLGAIGTGLGVYNLVSNAFSGDGSGSQITTTGGSNMASGTQMVSVNGGTAVGGVSFGGPGVPEPPAAMVAKAWKTKSFSNTVGEYWVYFWKLTDGRILCWNAAKREAKIWRPKKPVVYHHGKLTLSKAVKIQKELDRLWHTVARKTKQLKLA